LTFILWKGLEYFKHIFLLASAADKYAPFNSARIEITSSTLTDKHRGESAGVLSFPRRPNNAPHVEKRF